MTTRAERPDTVTREFILARCTNVQLISPKTADELVPFYQYQSTSFTISERDTKVYRLIAEMFEARAKEVV
jgi:hypothetical protein